MSAVPMLDRPTPRRLQLLLAGACAGALALVAAGAQAATPAAFNADYSASYMGLQANGKMRLAADGANRWKYTLEVTGAGARLTQSTVFEEHDGQWRPLSSSDSQRGEGGVAAMLVKPRTVNATYDWNRKMASWTGDVRPERAGPVALRAGDLDGMLMNLALARDVNQGRPLSYRMVEDGRVREQVFRTAGTETIDIDGKPHKATKVVWNGDSRSITAWVVKDLPVPARILQQRNGRDHIDLRLRALR